MRRAFAIAVLIATLASLAEIDLWQRRHGAEIHSLDGWTMASTWRASFVAPADFDALALRSAIEAELGVLDRQLSGYRDSAELSILNRSPVGEWRDLPPHLATVRGYGLSLKDAAEALKGFSGTKRRLEVVGTANGVTVIDDFAHNPDKIDATLATMHEQPGRVLVLFQPHGFGPLLKMGEELAERFARGLGRDDRLYLPDPVYHGGTTDKSRGSDWLAAAVEERGGKASHTAEREAIGDALIAEVRDGDRILIMGARDDTLSEFARHLLERLGN